MLLPATFLFRSNDTWRGLLTTVGFYTLALLIVGGVIRYVPGGMCNPLPLLLVLAVLASSVGWTFADVWLIAKNKHQRFATASLLVHLTVLMAGMFFLLFFG